MKNDNPIYISLLHPSKANQELLKNLIDSLYTKNHIVTPLILSPAIILSVTNQAHNLKNIKFPSLSTDVEFNRYEYVNNMIFLTTHNTEFSRWYRSLQSFFPESIPDKFLFPYKGFLLTEKSSGENKITFSNNDWFIAQYAVTYKVDEGRVVSFYREKIEQKHLHSISRH